LFKGKYIASNAQSGVTCPDFAEIAKAFGLPSFQIRTWKDFDEVIPEVQAYDGPLICEVFTHPEQLFVPKLSTIHLPDGKLVSPPLEDLSPLLPRQVLRKEMLVGLHPKSESMN
jgi:acetolactate synthase I/II/III large subunit